MPRSGRPPDRGGRTSTGDLSRIGVKDRRDGGGRIGAPYLVPTGLAVLAAVAVWLGWGRLASCGASLESPDTQIRRSLATQDRAHLADVYGFRGGGTLELLPVRFADVTTSVERGRATVVAMLSAEGRAVWRDQEAKVAYVGRERFHMKPCSIALWCSEGDQFDRLRGVLLALFRHRDAYRLRDTDAVARLLAPDYRDGGEDRSAALRRVASAVRDAPPARVVAWQIRVERSGAEVGEDLEVMPPDAPPRRERHVYRLVWTDERWVFTGGV